MYTANAYHQAGRGGVFVISGTVVEQVANAGPVSTYGENDMVLDN